MPAYNFGLTMIQVQPPSSTRYVSPSQIAAASSSHLYFIVLVSRRVNNRGERCSLCLQSEHVTEKIETLQTLH